MIRTTVSSVLLALAPAFVLAVAPATAAAQRAAPPAGDGAVKPLPEGGVAYYTVGGERHGVSFFRQVRQPEVEYEAGETLTFDRYHTVDVMYTWLRRWAERYPNIVELYEVGRSFEGRPILQITLTNKETGKATDKPAAFFEGGRHSGEITGSESILWLAKHLIEGYGKDARITKLLDENAIHLRPQNNPDGSNLYLHTAQRNRSSVRPVDNDGDGLLDEDPEEDLDGDGIIHQIRWRARPSEDGEGMVCWTAPNGSGRIMRSNARLDPRDPSGRLMQNMPAGEGDWCVITEGVDDDGDGRFNEDGIGGLDLHRNYPENWRPMPGQDRTGRGYTQPGAGEHPLSEPETYATVMWLLSHPHVSVVNSMDTRVPMHLRPPSTSKSSDRMYPEDLRWYQRFDSIGLSHTRYPWAGDVYETYATRVPVHPVTGDSARPGPLFGHGPDFGYFYYGSIWYGDEIWNGGAMQDYNGDGLRDDADAIVWDDRENGGRGFREWEPFRHPQLGDVEIGGFHPKFFAQNGPPHVLEQWARNQALFNLDMALHLPRVEIEGVDVRRVAAQGDSTDYEVRVRWRNTGRLPTALKQAQLVKIVQEDRVQLEFADSLTKLERPVVRIVEPARRDKVIRAGWTEPGERKTVAFRVRTYGVPGVDATVNLLSTRGGKQSRAVRLGQPVAE